MVAQAAPDWTAWRREIFGEPYLVWHDGPDFDAVLGRWADDPREVLQMLSVGLAEGDSVAAQTVTVLVKQGYALAGVEQQLRDCLPHASGTFRVRIAEALYAITGDDECADLVCGVLANGTLWGERVDAAIALSAFPPSPSVATALARGVGDDEYLVRRHAAQTMLTLAGRQTTIESVPDIWNLIRSERNPRSWGRAADRLRALLSE